VRDQHGRQSVLRSLSASLTRARKEDSTKAVAERIAKNAATTLPVLARYTHRVAISNSRLVGLDERGVTLCYKDYRRDGRARFRTMTLAPGEFIRHAATEQPGR
jgi:hypothetical protein